MDALKDFVKDLKDRLKSDAGVLGLDEAATKQGIILPILHYLGWNTFDVMEVYPEYNMQGKKVDFSLRIGDSNRVFIEAKKSDSELDDHQEQLLTYSFKEGVKLSVLTNGLTWWFYLSLKEGSWEQRKFYTIHLPQQDLEDVTTNFNRFLLKENVKNGQAQKNAEDAHRSQTRLNTLKLAMPQAWNRLLQGPDEILLDLIAEATEELCGYKPDTNSIKAFLQQNMDELAVDGAAASVIDKPKSEVAKAPTPKKKIAAGKQTKAGNDFTGKRVIAFSFGGTRYEVDLWKDVLTCVCGLLLKKHGKAFESVFKMQGRKRSYFSRDPEIMKEPREIGSSGIFVETHFSAKGIVKMCDRALQAFGYSIEDMQIEVE